MKGIQARDWIDLMKGQEKNVRGWKRLKKYYFSLDGNGCKNNVGTHLKRWCSDGGKEDGENDIDFRTQGPKIDLEDGRIFYGGIGILDAIFDLSLGLYSSRSFLGFHMYFDFSFLCRSFDCIVCKRYLGTHIAFEFFF